MSAVNYIAYTEMIPSQINNRRMINKACNIFGNRIDTLSTAVNNSKKMSTQVFDVIRPASAHYHLTVISVMAKAVWSNYGGLIHRSGSRCWIDRMQPDRPAKARIGEC